MDGDIAADASSRISRERQKSGDGTLDVTKIDKIELGAILSDRADAQRREGESQNIGSHLRSPYFHRMGHPAIGSISHLERSVSLRLHQASPGHAIWNGGYANNGNPALPTSGTMTSAGRSFSVADYLS
jgi:hypothetical protein